MKADEILELVTTDDVIKILDNLGSQVARKDSEGNIYFQTVCHGGDSHKLHYFVDSGVFSCYTACGTMSLFDVIMNANNWEFIDALKYVASLKGRSLNKRKVGLQTSSYINEDIEFLNIHLNSFKKLNAKLPIYDPKIMDFFDDYYPEEWNNEGITEDIAKYFGIKFYFQQGRVIIPHHNISGDLVGIRGRSFLKHDIDAGRKYMPVIIQNKIYKHPTNFNLYGIYQNNGNIRKIKRAVLFEGEKSVLKYGSYYGQNNNISLATLGMTFSIAQREILLNCGVEEVTICFDKQYMVEYLDKKNTKEYKEFERYIRNLAKIASMLIGYCNVYVVLCWGDLIDYKDAPIDKGKEIFEELFKNYRYLISDVDEIMELIK